MRPAQILAIASACGAMLLCSAASAQAPGQAAPPTAVAPASPGPPARSGFVIGVALGPGSIAAVESDTGEVSNSFGGFSVNLQLGGLVNPRLAIIADLWSVFHEDESFGSEFTLSHNIVTVAAKYWLAPRLWLSGGIGRANYTVIEAMNTYDSNDVPALMVGAGYELSHSRSFSLDLQGRFGAAEYDEGELRSGAVVLGLNWY